MGKPKSNLGIPEDKSSDSEDEVHESVQNNVEGVWLHFLVVEGAELS